MTLAAIIAKLTSLGVRVVSPAPGRIKLVGAGDQIPTEAIETAKPYKAELLTMLDRSADLPRCSSCDGSLLAVPTFDGFENFECMACDRCSGCRPVEVAA